MIRKFFIGLVLFTMFINSVLAQESYVISGLITDGKNPVPGAAIYVGSHKLTTFSDNEGRFNLPKLVPGNYDILVQMLGFKPASTHVVLSSKPVQVTITMQENPFILNEVVIKPDPNRTFHLNFFKENFIGKTANAAECRILNPEVLSFDDHKTRRTLTATASDFLIIENKALGYRLRYLLEAFEYDYASKVIFYAGYPHFEEMPGSHARKKKWQKKRATAYYGSIQHFFKSLYHKELEKEGYTLYKWVTLPNPARQPDSMISANVKRLMRGQQGLQRALTFTTNDSLAYWLRQQRLPRTIATLDRSPILVDTLVKTYDKDLKMAAFKDDLYVLYKNEKEAPDFMHSGFWISRPPDIKNVQISTLRLWAREIRFYASGSIYDPKSSLFSGYWGYEKIADMVPADYTPL